MKGPYGVPFGKIMKIVKEEEFKPITIKITFESEDEIDAFKQVYYFTPPETLMKDKVSKTAAYKILDIISKIYHVIL